MNVALFFEKGVYVFLFVVVVGIFVKSEFRVWWFL